MNKAKITSIHLHLEGHARATILCPDNTTIDIEIPRESLEGKTMDERYEAINQRAYRYISCLEKENEGRGGPFTEIATKDAESLIRDNRAENLLSEVTARSRTEVMAQSELS